VHIGIHNLPDDVAVDILHRMAEYTRARPEAGRDAILEFLHSQPGTLIAVNDPLWDEIRGRVTSYM